MPLILVCATVMLNRGDRRPLAQKPLALIFRPAMSPVPEKAAVEPQRPVAQQRRPVERKPAALIPPPIVPVPSPLIPPAVTPPAPAEVKPRVAEAAPPAPRPQAVDPVPQASHGPDKWEARVIARLERFRHYPADARKARQRGTALIRFRIDRGGHVLSSSLARSSGFRGLDEAALETLRDADPLPKIPADRPDQLELVVPVEFYIGR